MSPLNENVFPSTYPSSRRPCWNASMRGAITAGEEVMRNPIRGIFVGCCASAGEQSAKSNDRDFSLHVFLCSFHPTLVTHPSAHLITLSARNSTDCGIVRLSAFAVLRLMTNSNFVGCSTGKSAGLAPFNILSTYVAAR